MTFQQQTQLRSPTGAKLNLLIELAQGEARGVVQINHGVAEHAARYGRFARYLSARGWHVFAHDHRGHGFTTAPDAPAHSFGPNGGRKVLDDVLAVHDRISTDHPGLPVVLFGHSMGGLIALNFLFRHQDRVTAAAIWNANFSAGLAGRAALAILAWERFRMGSDVPSRILPRLTFDAWSRQVPERRSQFDWLSRDRTAVDAYVAGPLCGWNPSVGMWQDIFRFIVAGADDAKLRRIRRELPIHLVGGGADPSTSNGKAVADLADRMRRSGFSNLVSTIYADNRHESLNELNRDLIMSEFADWAEKRVNRS